ncbi:MAG TPA: UvrD-helicase domain-containing protein [Allosphingosinicella sp.]|nr:UvrD-helicase domain-containing protein [Allosphingosinicella sp.]
MTYVAIRRDAIEEIIAERLLQSTDFEKGTEFAKAIQAKQAVDVTPRIEMRTNKNGIFIFGRSGGESHYVVFDVEQAGGLSPGDSCSNTLLFIQKTLRFATKYWGGKVLTPSESVVSNSTRGIIFPFPISQQTNVRMVIDLSPDAERLARRGKAGRYLLVFKIADDSSGSEEPALATFRRFLDDLDALGSGLEATAAEVGPVQIAGLSSTSLVDLETHVDPHLAYETWMHLLTNDQRDFVTAPLISPRRVDGPAGSGKTVSLALSAVHAMKQAEIDGTEYNAMFVTHSEASRKYIETVIASMGGGKYVEDQSGSHHLTVSTLQGYCASILRQDLSATEFVDPDAYDAKQLQTMYVEEALKAVKSEISTFERFMSPAFRDYIANEDENLKLALIQHEIAVVIKGRSRESLDIYKKIPAISSGLPIISEGDKAFIWRIYENYRAQLVTGGQFDTDDVVLTALGQLSTPIWRRRRVRDGFDALFVDETHLFNMNELSVFHHLTKSTMQFPIAFAVDRAQAIGDRGWSDDIDITSLVPSGAGGDTSKVKLNSIFRSSPDIVNLAFTITSSGASLFTNFDDPLARAHSNMTFVEEKKAKPPTYEEYASDAAMIEAAFEQADRMRDDMSTSRGEISIIASTEELFRDLERYAAEHGKPVESLKQRGDDELAKRAKATGRFVLSMPDYVGGLEFDGVVLVGVDQGRVPPLMTSHLAESRAYMTFAAHNKLYVAISRARYRVLIMGARERGASTILDPAFAMKALTRT